MNAQLLTAYRGEIYGIAFFSYFAKNYADKTRLTLWETLIQVETVTANLLEPHLRTSFIPFKKDDVEMQAKGIVDAEKWISLPWDELTEILTDWVEPYEVKYREWYAEAEKNQEAFALIADHETAIFECWKAFKNGEDGEKFLRNFIQQYSA
ncbi:hypothetical protein [Enterovibrio nigricans]|uniref:Uncharacterized protein n=1 Tax=Enterovibrio nigricans DSM 22720 TaxID=1121868 RepID=A0A1T4VR00_9GAMM|nr:hypothetical protein [Enterovibrio nigricans]PKF48863.1 hypothetical protein AT251_23030 [Enterovibrio nigricans]SKA67413.1 hypothetical protein SAMN02745132_04207 [Enterovibrio nigricans DSM 22720]